MGLQDRVKKHLKGKRGSFLAAIEDMHERHGAKPRATDNCIRVSSVSTNNCPRYFVLQLMLHMGPPDNIDPKLRRIFDVGSTTHTMLQHYAIQAKIIKFDWKCQDCNERTVFRSKKPKECPECGYKFLVSDFREPTIVKQFGVVKYLKTYDKWTSKKLKSGKKKRVKKSVTEEIDLSIELRGSCDGILVLHKNAPEEALEAKTMNMFGFKGLRGPKPHHVIQNSVYADGLDIERIRPLYICKNTQEIVEWPQQRNDIAVKAVHETCERVVEAFEELKLPKFLNSKQCNGCSMLPLCEQKRSFKQVRGNKFEKEW